ncbi:T3SS effector HopA1 family protein [Sinosporangium siamense]|uniref:Uncharacterized protein n=1 Tax=Sinosporangium siamense TaxID=1367973 RepID=A0A919RQ32_9ACTN|nr:T3SS effector HopA1 family protein [Sinosporangium siamense]GII96129.1 hypothetical protein Ssi02_63600 [Sinosporangium siamense]
MIHPDIPAAGAMLAGLPPDQEDLERTLYSWYLTAIPLPPRPASSSPLDVNPGGALDAAHADSTRFVGGWRAESTTPRGGVVASNGELRRHLPRSGYTVPARPGLPARPGDALLARAAWTWHDTDRGFWHTRRGIWPPKGADRLTRTYLNVSFDGAPRVIALLTRLLAEHPHIAYQIKLPLSAGHSGRADAVVLYLGAPDAADLDADLRAVAAALTGVLRPPRPRFTHALAPGIGQAEGPLDGASFGQTRCGLLAQTWRAMPSRARHDPPAVTRAITTGFTSAGIDPARPYLLAVGDEGHP